MSAPTPEPAPLDLDALERLLTRATKAPWRVVLDDSENATTVWQVCTSPDHPTEDDPDRIAVYDCCADGGLHSEPWYTEADAEFVAALRNAADGLIRRAREADRLRPVVDQRDELVGVIASMISLPPEKIAEIYQVGYGAAVGPDAPVEPIAAHVQADPDLPAATERALGNLVRAAAADHPHTDPGDGRTECQPCGKYVWPVTHSCKGVPVTEAARARATDGGDPR